MRTTMSSPFRDQRARWTKPEHVAENAVYKQLLGDVIKKRPPRGEVPAEQAEGAHSPEVIRLEGDGSTDLVLGRCGHLCG